MRRLVGLLVVSLGTQAMASPKPPPPSAAARSSDREAPLRVLRIMAESQQVLLFDKAQRRAVLVEVGTQVAGFTVIEIDDETVTLGARGRQLVLSTPPRTTPVPVASPPPAPIPETTPAPPTSPASTASTPAPTPTPVPTAPPAPTTPAPATSPATPATPTTGPAIVPASPTPPPEPAPISPYDQPIAGPVPIDPYEDDLGKNTPTANIAPAPAPAPGSAPPVTEAPTSLSIVLARGDVAAALLDFAGLAKTVSGSFTPAGVKLERLADGSLLAKAGLRAGDLVISVDGKPLRTLDDAADLYARGETLRAATLQLQRAGKPVTLRLVIR